VRQNSKEEKWRKIKRSQTKNHLDKQMLRWASDRNGRKQEWFYIIQDARKLHDFDKEQAHRWVKASTEEMEQPDQHWWNVARCMLQKEPRRIIWTIDEGWGLRDWWWKATQLKGRAAIEAILQTIKMTDEWMKDWSEKDAMEGVQPTVRSTMGNITTRRTDNGSRETQIESQASPYPVSQQMSEADDAKESVGVTLTLTSTLVQEAAKSNIIRACQERLVMSEPKRKEPKAAAKVSMTQSVEEQLSVIQVHEHILQTVGVEVGEQVPDARGGYANRQDDKAVDPVDSKTQKKNIVTMHQQGTVLTKVMSPKIVDGSDEVNPEDKEEIIVVGEVILTEEQKSVNLEREYQRRVKEIRDFGFVLKDGNDDTLHNLGRATVWDFAEMPQTMKITRFLKHVGLQVKTLFTTKQEGLSCGYLASHAWTKAMKYGLEYDGDETTENQQSFVKKGNEVLGIDGDKAVPLSKLQIEQLISILDPKHKQPLRQSIVGPFDMWAVQLSEAASSIMKGIRQEPGCWIVNTDDSRTKGDHWVTVMVVWKTEDIQEEKVQRKELSYERTKRENSDKYAANIKAIQEAGYFFPAMPVVEDLPITEGVAKIFDIVNYKDTDVLVKLLKSFGLQVFHIRPGTATNNFAYGGYTSARIASVVDVNFLTADYLKSWYEDDIVKKFVKPRRGETVVQPKILSAEEVGNVWLSLNKRSTPMIGSSDSFARWLVQEMCRDIVDDAAKSWVVDLSDTRENKKMWVAVAVKLYAEGKSNLNPQQRAKRLRMSRSLEKGSTGKSQGSWEERGLAEGWTEGIDKLLYEQVTNINQQTPTSSGWLDEPGPPCVIYVKATLKEKKDVNLLMTSMQQRIPEVEKWDLDVKWPKFNVTIYVGNTIKYLLVKHLCEGAQFWEANVSTEWIPEEPTEQKNERESVSHLDPSKTPAHLLLGMESDGEVEVPRVQRRIPIQGERLDLEAEFRRKFSLKIHSSLSLGYEYVREKRARQWQQAINMWNDTIIPFVICAAVMDCKFEFTYLTFSAKYGDVNEFEKRLWEDFPGTTEWERRCALIHAASCQDTKETKRKPRADAIIATALSYLRKNVIERWEKGYVHDEIPLHLSAPSAMEETSTIICTIGEGDIVHKVGVFGAKWPKGEYIPMRNEDGKLKKWRVLRHEYSAWSTILTLMNYSEHENLITVFEGEGVKRNGGVAKGETLRKEVQALRVAAREALERNDWICLWELSTTWSAGKYAPFSYEKAGSQCKRFLEGVKVHYGLHSKQLHDEMCHQFYKYLERACHEEYQLA